MTYANTDTARAAEWMAQHQCTHWCKWAETIWKLSNDAAPSDVSEAARCRLGNRMLAKALADGTGPRVSIAHVMFTAIADVWLANTIESGYVPLGLEAAG